MRILFLTGRLPYPPTRGDRLRAYHFLRVLSREHRLTLLSFIADDEEAGNVGPLRAYCEDIQLIHRGRQQSILSAGVNAWRREPLQSLYYRSTIMRAAVDRLLARRPFDAIYVHLFRMAQFVADRERPYRILDLTDVISSEIERSLPYRGGLWRLVYRLELPRIRRYEREIAARFDETWLISDAERELFLADGPAGNAYVVANGVDTERFRPTGRAPAGGLIFVGHMGVFHNVDAAEWLVNEILPLIRQEYPGVRLDLVGAEPSAAVQALAGPGVHVVGHTPDLNTALISAQVFVAPLRFAAGIQNKVLEAMAAGLPVVTTSHVNAGLGAADGRHLIVADEAEAFAEAVVGLLRDPERRRRFGREGRTFVAHHYRWEGVLDRVATIERQLGAH
jgi:sugar transferase (PEP-CTERM/EpsH1 system associated)